MDADTPMKRCPKCGEWKPATEEYFYRADDRPGGLRTPCKTCAASRRALHYAANADKIKASAAAYREANRDKVKVRRAAYHRANAELITKKVAAWRSANPEKVKVRGILYRAANAERRKANAHRRRAIKRSLPIVWTPAIQEVMLIVWERRCAYCNSPLDAIWHADHFYPLVLGGGTVPENMLPACPRCNLGKNHSDPLTWIKRRFGKDAARILRKIEEYFQLWKLGVFVYTPSSDSHFK